MGLAPQFNNSRMGKESCHNWWERKEDRLEVLVVSKKILCFFFPSVHHSIGLDTFELLGQKEI